MRKGPLNSYVDPTEFGAGSAILEVSEAVKASGGYDPWSDLHNCDEELKDGIETVKEVNVKVGCTITVFIRFVERTLTVTRCDFSALPILTHAIS